jgi:cytochrome c oxidase assembly factor CtaG
VASLVLPATASAHGGKRLAIRHAGPYLVEVYAALLPAAPGYSSGLIDYTVYLHDARTFEPVDDARVVDTVRAPEGVIGPLTADALGNSYEILLRIPRPNEWRRWRLHVRVSGPEGSAALDYTPPGLASAWLLDPWVLAAAALALAMFVRGFLRLRRRRAGLARWWRGPVFLAGLALLVLPLVSPLDAVGDDYLLSAHMLQHVLIGDAAPALLLLALSGPLVLFVVPRRVLVGVHRTPWLSRGLGVLGRPAVALGVWVVVMAGWHVPAAYDYTLTHQTVHDLMHLCFAAAGLLVWWQLVHPRPRRAGRSRRIAFALVVFALGQVLADVLILSFEPYYPAYAAQAERLFGLSPLTDQRLAGVVMMGEQVLTMGTCVACLLVLRARARRSAPQPLGDLRSAT